MRSDETAFTAHDAGWPAEVDRALAGEASERDELVVARWIAAHPGAEQFLTVLRNELDPPPAGTFDAAAMFTRIVGPESKSQQAVREPSDIGHTTSRPYIPRADSAGTGKHSIFTIVRTIVDELAGQAVAAFFGKRDAELAAQEIDQLRALIKNSEPETK